MVQQRYVIDTSALMQAFVRDTHTSAMHAFLMRPEGTTIIQLYVLELALAEGANVLWKRARQAGMSEQEARASLAGLMALPLVVYPLTPLLARALAIGLAHNLAVYDSAFLAVAERLHLSLITADARQTVIAGALNLPTISPGALSTL